MHIYKDGHHTDDYFSRRDLRSSSLVKMAFLCSALLVLACAAVTFSVTLEPEYLDSLLASKNYEEFARVMGIENVDYVKPEPASADANPMFNEGLFSGDIMLTPQESEQARQGIRFDRYSGSKWPGKPAFVPYVLSGDFTDNERRTIENTINNEWNRQSRCVKWGRRNGQADYVFMFPGRGCWSYLGRISGQQSLSLQRNGCVYTNIILHEMDHAIGFAHEHNRSDRDDYIEILWENIPDEWKSQYEKTNPRDYGLQDRYDYYSIMHYPVNAPGTNKPAFRVKQNGIDERRIGNAPNFTPIDIRKIDIQYC